MNSSEHDMNNPSADSAGMGGIASANEATGLMYDMPLDAAQYDSERQLHTLGTPRRPHYRFPGRTDTEAGDGFPIGPDEILPGWIPPYGWPNTAPNTGFMPDEKRSSRRPLTAWDVMNGEGEKS
ncbi:MAG: hypothetical protein J5544_04920 [Clostridia bacterium]|nr:hypothetical protein [Clostridia bacterium]